MDGDIAPIPEVVALCRKYEALLMVDEAHSIGFLGKTGRGIQEHFGLEADDIDIKMGNVIKGHTERWWIRSREQSVGGLSKTPFEGLHL